MLKIGIIGAGIICGRHISAVQKSGKATVVAVCDLIAERASFYATECGALAFTDYQEMVERVAMDAVIINLPHGLHEPCGSFVAEHGIHILMEKPLSTSKQSCVQLIEACKKNNVLLQVGHVQRFFPENIMAHDYIQTQKLGELCMISDTRTSFYFDEKRPKWFLNKELAGGGILMNFGAHSLDKLLFLTDSTIQSISGHCVTHGQEVEGSAQFLVTMQSGITASVSLCGFNHQNENCTILYFTNGVLKLETGKGLSVLTDDGFEQICESSTAVTFENQMLHFIDSITGVSPCTVPGEYGLQVITAIEQLYAE